MSGINAGGIEEQESEDRSQEIRKVHTKRETGGRFQKSGVRNQKTRAYREIRAGGAQIRVPSDGQDMLKQEDICTLCVTLSEAKSLKDRFF